MAPLRTDTALAAGQLSLVVFMPDAIKSHLVQAIERWIAARTSCAPVARQWFSHTEGTIERFYPGVAERCAKEDWHLLTRVFSAGPCLATLWFGEDAARRIAGVKGQTHPARCSSSTLRGRFWCDNPVSNLVHVSDDGADVARELGVLRSIEPDLFVGGLSTRGLSPFRDPGPPAARHSSILTLCSLVQTALAARLAIGPILKNATTRCDEWSAARGDTVPALDVPESGDAKETMARAEAWLEQTRTSASLAVSEAVGAYLNGTANASRFIRALRDDVRVDAWQELVLRCGILSRAEWLGGVRK